MVSHYALNNDNGHVTCVFRRICVLFGALFEEFLVLAGI